MEYGNQDTAEPWQELLIALTATTERRHHDDETWLYLADPNMPRTEHGWKLHISSRPAEFPDVIRRIVPILRRYTCDAKFARNMTILHELNSGTRSPAAVGKAATVYPLPAEAVRLGRELAGALVGCTGPRVVSDRQVLPGAPVYYRYGPFHASARPNLPRSPGLIMNGPDGQRFAGLAEAVYREPPWATDPFRSGDAPGRAGSTTVGGGRYRITAGIVRSAGGNVYRAVEVATGRPVVVKQARPHVAEDGKGRDARGRLRQERRVLGALSGVGGVPAYLDYFRHGDDEFLVTSACGPRDLRREVLAHGPYTDDDPARDWRALATGLLRLLDDVHARGVVVCDLKPGNVVLDSAGACTLVDFGVSALDDEPPGGGTPGYSMPVFRAVGPARPADDYYALGATLHFALTGLDPVVIDADRRTNRDRTLACLAEALTGDGGHAARSLVAGLLSLDGGERAAVAARLREGEHHRPPDRRRARRPSAAPSMPARVRVDASLLDDVIAHTVAYCSGGVRRLIAGTRRPSPPRVALYDGSAGLGLELLHHTDRPGVAAAVTDLARWTAEHPGLPSLPLSFYGGRTGVDLFLAAASTVLGAFSDEVTVPPGADLLPPDEPADQISGAAGIGTGLLLLAGQARSAGAAGKASAYLSHAAARARGIVDGRHRTGDAVPDRPDPAAAALAHGFAHGDAGIASFLLLHHETTGDTSSGAAADLMLARLAERLPALVAASGRPGASRRWASWCRGLAGIGSVFVQAAAVRGDDDCLTYAGDAALACHALAPRMGLVTQCCGLAGVGELLVDLGAATQDTTWWDKAEDVARLILARSGGTPRQPVFPGDSFDAANPYWANGSAGTLSFLRRLRDRGGPRLYVTPPTGR